MPELDIYGSHTNQIDSLQKYVKALKKRIKELERKIRVVEMATT